MSSVEREPESSPRRLVRTRRGRLVGGVCSGLGAHFGVDPILLRIAFVGLALFAGAGIWLYLAILLLVPEEGTGRAPIRLRRSSLPSILGALTLIVALGIALSPISHAALGDAWPVGVGVGALALLGAVATLVWLRPAAHGAQRTRASADRRLVRVLAFITAVACGAALLGAAGAWLAGTQPHAAAWTVVAVGAVLVASAFAKPRWLVLPALAFALPVAIFTAARVDLHGGVGERVYRPSSLGQLRSGYRLGAGRLEVDLRGVQFPAGDTRLRVRLGVGELVVLVPDRVCVRTDAHIGGGFVGALDRQSGGLDVSWSNGPAPPRGAPRLRLEGHVGLGALFVVDRPLSGKFEPGLYGTNSACRGAA